MLVSVGVHLVEHDTEFFKISKSIILLRANKFNADRMYNGRCCITVNRLSWIDFSIQLNKLVTIMIRYCGFSMVIIKWPAAAIEHEGVTSIFKESQNL